MSGKRFWEIETIAEGHVIRDVIKRRFPLTYAILTESLEKADPMDVVYPNNPDEYSDVVLEILALLAPLDGSLDLLSSDEIENVVREGLGRCFGDEPDDSRVARAVELIKEGSLRSGL